MGTAPTESPSYPPTVLPTFAPTATPTTSPTVSPTDRPSQPPSTVATARPSYSPTVPPTRSPTQTPTMSPTVSPTKVPSPNPSRKRTKMPIRSTKRPTGTPPAPAFQVIINPTYGLNYFECRVKDSKKEYRGEDISVHFATTWRAKPYLKDLAPFWFFPFPGYEQTPANLNAAWCKKACNDRDNTFHITLEVRRKTTGETGSANLEVNCTSLSC